MKVRPRRRTVLDVPGHVERKLAKGIASAADALMVDLEDSVPAVHEMKVGARATVEAALRGADRDVVLRVNEVPTPWFDDDVALAVDLGVSGIVVPKMRTLDELLRADARLDELGAPDTFEIWAIVESPPFLLTIEAAAGDLPPRLSALVAGVVDFMLELNPAVFLTPLGLDDPGARRQCELIQERILMTARSAGSAPIFALTVAAITDTDQAEAEAVAARAAGWDTVILLHPAQIDPANRAFEPSEEVVARARSYDETGKRAAEAGRVSAIVDGRVVLPQHVKAARALLDSAGR